MQKRSPDLQESDPGKVDALTTRVNIGVPLARLVYTARVALQMCFFFFFIAFDGSLGSETRVLEQDH